MRLVIERGASAWRLRNSPTRRESREALPFTGGSALALAMPATDGTDKGTEVIKDAGLALEAGSRDVPASLITSVPFCGGSQRASTRHNSRSSTGFER